MGRPRRYTSAAGAGLLLPPSSNPCPPCTVSGSEASSLVFGSKPASQSPGWMLGRHAVRRSGGAPWASITVQQEASSSSWAPQSVESKHKDFETVTAISADQPDGRLQPLPVGTTRGNKLLYYAWDGKKMKAVEMDMLADNTHTAQFRDWLGDLSDRLRRMFLPEAKDVTPDYWGFIRWRLMQRFFSSTMQNLSTQSMLIALGMGAKRAIAASGAINWLLKDGVARLARMTVATNFGTSFDSDLKRIRFVTSIIFEVTMTCEFITPFFPHHFLPLASLASVGKAIALAAFVATTPAFQQALCSGGNLADLTAKNQAQHMLVDMLALAVSAGSMAVVRNRERARIVLPLCLFPLLAACDLLSIYKELKAVQLRSLNKERVEMVVDTWLAEGRVPGPGEISERERLLLPPDVCDGFLPLEIVPLHHLARSPTHLQALLQQYGRDKFIMAVRGPPPPVTPKAASSSQGSSSSSSSSSRLSSGLLSCSDQSSWLPWAKEKPGILLSLSEDAHPRDILTATLEAAYVRKAIREKLSLALDAGGGSSSRSGSEGGASSSSASSSSRQQHQQHQPSSSSSRGLDSSSSVGSAQQSAAAAAAAAHSGPGRVPPHWSSWSQLGGPQAEALVREGHERARGSAVAFEVALRAAGWRPSPFYLSTSEKQGYVRL